MAMTHFPQKGCVELVRILETGQWCDDCMKPAMNVFQAVVLHVHGVRPWYNYQSCYDCGRWRWVTGDLETGKWRKS